MSSSRCMRPVSLRASSTGRVRGPDRAGRDRTPTIPGHEVSGVVAELGYGTTGLTVGQRVFGLTDWARNGTLAEYVAVEARNLAPVWGGHRPHRGSRPADFRADCVAGAVRPRRSSDRPNRPHPRRRRCRAGSLAVQLARETGATVIGSGRAAHRETVLDLGADAFLDLQRDALEDVGDVDVVLDVLGGDVLDRSAKLFVPAVSLSPSRNHRGCAQQARAVFFVVEPDRPRCPPLSAGFATVDCVQLSTRYIRWHTRCPPSTQISASAARRSSGLPTPPNVMSKHPAEQANADEERGDG